MASVMLTTVDNPFNPFDDFKSWFLFDQENGYNSAPTLARKARTSDQLSDAENDLAIEEAIDEIIKLDFMNIYKKIHIEDSKDFQKDSKE